MRKTQFALAALALVASTAAMADGATVYGTLDVSAAKVSGKSTAIDGTGNWDTSVLGIKGSEELTGGMKAIYQLEMGLNIGTGAGSQNGGANGSLFNRLANVGLSGEFGSSSLGLQFSPYIGAALGGVVSGNESFYVPMLVLGGKGAVASGSTSSTLQSNGFFIPNAISYTTPSISGFNATVLSQVAAGVDNDKYSALGANYAAGDIAVHAGYQDRSNYNKSSTITASYTMGQLGFGAGYVRNTPNAAAAINVYNIGASYAVADNTHVSLQYARNNEANAKSIVNGGLQYNLSKATYLFGTISRAQNGALALYSTGSTGNVTGYAVGINKAF
jgi:predicted porin